MDPDIRRILYFLEVYLTSGYLGTPYPDKNNKNMDLPNKDPDPNTLKFSRYPIRRTLVLSTYYALCCYLSIL